MVSFSSVSALRAAMPQVRDEIFREGKLSVGGKEYKVNVATQEFIRVSSAADSASRFFEATEKLFREGSPQSVAKAIGEVMFNNEYGQSQRLQTPSSVEHARMLFKNGDINTTADVLSTFEKIDPKIMRGNSTEFSQLANRAMTETMLDTDSGKRLTSLIGKGAACALAGRVVADYGGGVAALQKSPTSSIGQMKAIFDMEIVHLKSAQQHIEGLASIDLSQGVYAEILPESTFNPTKLVSNVDRAVAWIINASNTKGNDAENIRALLSEYASSDKDLLNMNNLKQLHQRLVPNLERDYRGPNISGGTLPSSIGGEAMLKQHLESFLANKTVSSRDLGKHLLAGVIGYHGFTDGNGRMGRLLYAIAELRNDAFNPLSLNAENRLHGIK
ncbi:MULTISPECIES: VopS family T3SS effector adenosine monophosphate-protein transferase [Vibrio]|uniref:VopS family T3SS effector adenosine monophosphate-protein transferase n=1 Tax=Vibrio TaxID=662 RepID=UPI00056F4E0A|nr:VopS family T3SS effector adenosine monophosphate-protein transferase [Vibrio pacinii]